MIIIECILRIIKYIIRFFVWVVTARDATHCANAMIGSFSGTKDCEYCGLCESDAQKCKESVIRPKFIRSKKKLKDYL